MKPVVGLDGAPGGWAAVLLSDECLEVRRVEILHEFLADAARYEVVAIDIPIGLMDRYEIGGRSCDRAARAILGKRASSVFPAPVRGTLNAETYAEACAISRSSGRVGKAITKQTFHILPKIREVDRLLHSRPELRHIIREVHPEVSFRELSGSPLAHSKKKSRGKAERRYILKGIFPEIEALEAKGRACGLPSEDIFDAAVACWSARRLASGTGRSLPEHVAENPKESVMTIWV